MGNGGNQKAERGREVRRYIGKGCATREAFEGCEVVTVFRFALRNAALKAAALRLDLKAKGDRGSFGRCGGLDDDNKKGGGPPHNGVQRIAIL